jgi:hypothetical protein
MDPTDPRQLLRELYATLRKMERTHGVELPAPPFKPKGDGSGDVDIGDTTPQSIESVEQRYAQVMGQVKRYFEKEPS